MSDFAGVVEFLGGVAERSSNDEAFARTASLLKESKSQAVARGDPSAAKQAWCYEQILGIQRQYLDAFEQMRAGEYYKAWCLLEEVEIAWVHLEPHFACIEDRPEFAVRFIVEHVKKFQSLFPYRLFLSTEMVEKRILCSICRAPLSVRQSCGHEVGEIYDGALCHRIVDACELVAVSLVTQPRHKYAVAFPGSPEGRGAKDPYQYAPIRYLVGRLVGPFDAWDVRWTRRRQPHSRYADVPETAPCPCESSKPYKACCRRESGVLRPHCEFIFSVPPDPRLLTTEYA